MSSVVRYTPEELLRLRESPLIKLEETPAVFFSSPQQKKKARDEKDTGDWRAGMSGIARRWARPPQETIDETCDGKNAETFGDLPNSDYDFAIADPIPDLKAKFQMRPQPSSSRFAGKLFALSDPVRSLPTAVLQHRMSASPVNSPATPQFAGTLDDANFLEAVARELPPPPGIFPPGIDPDSSTFVNFFNQAKFFEQQSDAQFSQRKYSDAPPGLFPPDSPFRH